MMKKVKLFSQLSSIAFLLLLVVAFCISCANEPTKNTESKSGDYPEKLTISKSELADKIKGGWAGQVIGCTYGGPTEFRFKGTMINEYTPIKWDSTLMHWWYTNAPGLYDDVYMDLTFVDVFEKQGLDAPAKAHAEAFANAEYMLWHANQAARYNILNGIYPPQSGHWEYNPHSEDIDFQIEADFAGLMSPGMVNTATEISDKVGHIMNYGDGWYGGVYVASMYALAFFSDDVEFVVKEALKTIPEESTFYQCINDVINWYYEYPNDWKTTWFEAQKKWSEDIGCPDGVFKDFNIDAKINAAYIVIGMLYSGGDFGKAIDISTRCGQDSDCNPASAAGIIGTMIGYDNIPDYWKQGIDKVEDMDFKYTTMSLNDVYSIGLKHAMEIVKQNGGTVDGDNIEIAVQKPEAVALEVGFKNHFPTEFIEFGRGNNRMGVGNEERTFNFTGNGFIVSGGSNNEEGYPDKTVELEVYVDGKMLEVAKMPTVYQSRKHDVAWKYNLEEGEHQVKLKLIKPEKGYSIYLGRVIVYSSIR